MSQSRATPHHRHSLCQASDLDCGMSSPPHTPGHLSVRELLLLYIACVFVTCLLLGNLIAAKVASSTIGGYSFMISMGEIPFPITFILTDLLNEYYGKQVARRVTMIGFFMTALAFILVSAATYVPWAPVAFDATWQGVKPAAYDQVFASTPHFQLASMAAYLSAQFIDIGVFHALRRITNEKHLWLRATGSTVVSQLVDTIVVIFIAFGGAMSMGKIVSMIVSSYIVKVTVAIAMTPLIYALHSFIDRRYQVLPYRGAEQDKA